MIAALTAACLAAAILTTGAASLLSDQLGTVGTAIALTLMWVIAIAEVVVWLRVANPQSLGLKPLSKRDAVIEPGYTDVDRIRNGDHKY